MLAKSLNVEAFAADLNRKRVETNFSATRRKIGGTVPDGWDG
jgi:hypothetical protein